MSVREGMHEYLSEPRTLRACLYLAAALGLALLVLWPRGELQVILRTGQVTDTFTVVAICFLLAMLYLGARFGAQDFAVDTVAQLGDLAVLTPAPLLPVVASRLVFSLLHTVVLLLLGAPFLVAAMAVGGAGFPQALGALAMIGAASLAARTAGLCALVLLGGRRVAREIVLVTAVGGAAAVSFFFLPAVSSFRGISGLARPGAGVSLLPAAAGLAAAVLLSGAALAGLQGARARARRRAPGTGENG